MAEIINVELEQEVELQTSYELSGGIIPTGTINITTNGTHDVTSYANANVDVQGGVTPTGTKEIEVDAAGTITEDVTNYADVEITVPQGEYKPKLSTTITPSISISNGGLITATNITQILQDWTLEDFVEGYITDNDVSAKATVTGGSATHQLSTVAGQTVTPTTSQQEIAVQGDYITGSLKVGAIPSQYIVPSGTKTITTNGTHDVTAYASASVDVQGGITPTGTKSITIDSSGTTSSDVTNYATVEITVPSGSASTPATSVTANPSISVSSTGLITATASATQSVTPTVSSGWVSSGTSGTVTVSGSNTSQLSTQAAATITPTTSQQTAVASGKYTTGNVLVDPIPSQYIVPSGSQTITQNGTVDVTSLAEVVVNVAASGYDCDYGTFTPTSNEATHTVTVSKTRHFFVAWDDAIVATSNTVNWLYATTQYGGTTGSGAYGYTNTSGTMSLQTGLSTGGSWTSSQIKVGAGNSSRVFRNGTTYSWIAW